MRAMYKIIPAFATVAIASTAAHAQVCLKVDAGTDSMAPAERSASLSLVRASFQHANTAVVASPRVRQFSISTVKLGAADRVGARGPPDRGLLVHARLDDSYVRSGRRHLAVLFCPWGRLGVRTERSR